MTDRPTPIGSAVPQPRRLEPMARPTLRLTETFPDHLHLSPPPDVPTALISRPLPETAREATLPLAHERASRRLASWLSDAAQRPPYPFAVESHRPIPLAAALGCPDLFLLETPLGPDRLQAVVDLVDGARAAGQRVAILTATPDNANAIVLALPAEGVGRAKAESEGALPPVVAEQTARVMAAEDGRNRRMALLAQQQETTRQMKWWTEWNRILAAEAALAEEQGLLPQRAERIVDESDESITAEADIRVRRKAWAEAASAEAEARRGLEAQLAECRTAASLPMPGGFMKKLFGAAKPDPTLVENIAAAEAKLQEFDAAATERAAVIERGEQEYRDRRAARMTRELARLHAEQTERSANLTRDRDLWSASRPHASLESLQGLLADLDAKLADHPERLTVPSRESIQKLSVVVGPLAALETDPFFAPTHPETSPPFDRLLFADSEDLNEHDLTRAGRLAEAWVLLGCENLPKPTYRNGKPGRGEFFRQTLDAVAHFPWRTDSGRLVAVLAKSDPRSLRCEPLADRPTIELRFLERPDGSTELAEVAFPASFGLPDLKRFIWGELGIALAQFHGKPEWSTTADSIVCSWPGHGGGRVLDLAEGIRERLCGEETVEYRFSNAAGWTPESAEAWFRGQFAGITGIRAARLGASRR